MQKKDVRPINLDLTTINLPPPAIASILHRISGLFLFLLLPFMLWMLEKSVTLNGYQDLNSIMTYPLVRFVIWVMLSSLVFHLIAGIRHLLMDASIGEGLRSGTISAWIVFILSFAAIIWMGIWLW